MNTDMINKIKGLLAKTTESGCSEAEAQSAVALANKLITQYNISLEDIKSTEKTSDPDVWGEGKVVESGKYTLDISLAVGVVEQYFFVKPIIFRNNTARSGRKFKLCFYGKKENVITAKYVYDGLIAAFDNLWNSYRKLTKCKAEFRRIFIDKVAEGFSDKLKIDRYNMTQEMDKEKNITSGSTALVIRNIQEKTVQKFNQAYPNLKKPGKITFSIAQNDQVAQAGYSAGRKLNINRTITHAKKG